MPTLPSAHLRKIVRERAKNRCEYCQMSQEFQGAKFHIEHVIPKSKGGKTSEENLALACPSCNFYKANHTEFIDPQSLKIVKIFNPRIQKWNKYFKFEWDKIIGLTEVGRATIDLLRLNDYHRMHIREVERLLGLFPSEETL